MGLDRRGAVHGDFGAEGADFGAGRLARGEDEGGVAVAFGVKVHTVGFAFVILKTPLGVPCL